MVTLHDMALQGAPWRVTVDLSATSPQDIVVLKPATAITNPQQQYANKEACTILGWSVSALASGGGAGEIAINSVDYAITEGGTVVDPIHTYGWATSTYLQDAVTPAFITLRGAVYQPTPADPAMLRITTANITSGSLCLWGIFGSSDLQSAYSVTGSPVDRS